MTTRQLRVLRAASASSVATLLAAVSHTFAGGLAPHPLLMVAVSVLLMPLAAMLIGARLSKVGVSLTVFVCQAAFHLVFQVLGAPIGAETDLGHQHEMLALGPVTVAALPDPTMIIGHVLAGIATTSLLWHGERIVRVIAGWMLARTRHAHPHVPAECRRPTVLVSHRHPLVDAARSAAVSRRGPPHFS